MRELPTLKTYAPVSAIAKTLFGALSVKQEAIMEATEEELFLGGGAGSGKSRASIIKWASIATDFGMRGIRFNALALRSTFPQLREIIQLSKDLLLPLGATWSESTKTVTLPNGSSLECGYCATAEDRYQFQGRSWQFILWDEVQHQANPISYDWLFSRLRSPVVTFDGEEYNLPLMVVGTANPKGKGHNWLRKRFIDPAPGGGAFTREETITDSDGTIHVVKRTVRYIHSTVLDNPWLSKTDYVRNLYLLPEGDRRALLDGDFFATEGAFFTEFNRKIHVVKSFKVPADSTIIVGMDWGTASPAHVVWLTELSNGEVHVFAEYTTRDPEDWEKGTFRNATDVADDILRIETRNGWDISERWLDNSCWSDIGTDTNVAEILQMKGLFFQKAVKKKGLKARNLRELMKVTNGQSRLKIHANCKVLIQELETLMTDETDPSKWDEKGSDHGVDALQYGTSKNILALGHDALVNQKNAATSANRAKLNALARRRA